MRGLFQLLAILRGIKAWDPIHFKLQNCCFNVGMILKVHKLKLCKESIYSTENESHMITWAESVRRKNHM